MTHSKNEISKYMAKIARKAMKSLTKEERSLRGKYAVYVRECKKKGIEYANFVTFQEMNRCG